ncbi:MAG: 50S ribosomal protein L4 [Candidatus Roizmanbacteria bacterium]
MEKKTTKKQSVKKNLVIPLFDKSGKGVEGIEVPKEIFDIKASDILLAQYIRIYLDRQKNAYGKAKTRSEVKGSTRKIYRQKGTGRARHGANKAPIFVGGGVAHGPKGIKTQLRLNKKMITRALLYSLSKQLKGNRVIAIEDDKVFSGKTSEISTFLTKIQSDKKPLLVYSNKDNRDMIVRSIRNVPRSSYMMIDGLNAYVVLHAGTVVFTKDALNQFIERKLAKKN